MKIKKPIMIIAVVIIAVFGLRAGIYHFTDAKKIDGHGEHTVYEISRVLDDYMKSKDNYIRRGTEDYIGYLVDLLMFEDDEDLAALPEYEDILSYASSYVVESQYYNSDAFVASIGFAPAMPKSIRDKTIPELDDLRQKREVESNVGLLEFEIIEKGLVPDDDSIDIQYSTKNSELFEYKLTAKETKHPNKYKAINKKEAAKMAKEFAKTFIVGGDKMSLTNSPDHQLKSMYEPGKIESWYGKTDDKSHYVVVDFSRGLVLAYQRES